ncbi:MAG: formylglycine-generating enzyme family protein, partial [Nitrospira sp.]|nr:formylglycine-generating enzyme family protein [Nitrospira sp.]
MRSHTAVKVGGTIGIYVGLGVAVLAGTMSLATAADLPGSDKDMALVPKGEFTMGSSEHSDEAPHQVVLDAYRIDKFETSNARFTQFLK